MYAGGKTPALCRRWRYRQSGRWRGTRHGELPMTEEIPQDLVNTMMVKCGRRCCICRRFRPLKLQVHHIIERGHGGTNDEDNLIVSCMSCHSDIHSKVPFSRRFTPEELKGHRDALVKMVAEGKLPADDTDDADQTMAAIVNALRTTEETKITLSPEAVELLLAAVTCEGSRQGVIVASYTNSGLTLNAGNRAGFFNRGDMRSEARYEHAVGQLVSCGLARQDSGVVYKVTYPGYLAADELMATGAKE
jgi:hypothetical protein